MKNIEQILVDAGVELTDEQKSAINKSVAENYKTVAEVTKINKKLEDAQDTATALKEQIDTANATLERFKDIDPDKIADEIAGYKKAAEEAETKAQKQITERDQRDYLNAEFDKLNISSSRTRKSLMSDIMGDDGLKWKDGAFMGLNDFLERENAKDHFYQTQEEKDLESKQQTAAESLPKFTTKTEAQPANETAKIVPRIW